MSIKYFTSESVTEGHPDKLCDQISDSVLDALLAEDPMARVACETAATTGLVLVMGEISTIGWADIPKIVRRTINEIGYDGKQGGSFDGNTCAVITSIDEQSPDIALGVDNALERKSGGAMPHGGAAGAERGSDGSDGSDSSERKNGSNGRDVSDSRENGSDGSDVSDRSENSSDGSDTAEDDELNRIGAGDQGMMFGFACNETPELMPMPIQIAHSVCRNLAALRKSGRLPYLRPDGKSQVTVAYEGDKPVHIDTVVISTQHSDGVAQGELADDVRRLAALPALPPGLVDAKTKFYINPTGRFVIGGPQGDSGLTGRKIIVDTYGGFARHGGGAFSGKDPTKVDRAAAYAARHVAKNVVAAGLADRCEIQLAYAIGIASPVSIFIKVDTFGSSPIGEDEIVRRIKACFDLRPAAIIKNLGLRKPIYRQVAAYGHFGRSDLDLPWERLDKTDALLRA